MGLDSDEFKRIFDDGFCQRYEDNDEGESELRCFTCGKKAELKDVGSFIEDYKVVCEDEHEAEMIDFLVEHTNMRDGVTDRALSMMCSFDNVEMGT